MTPFLEQAIKSILNHHDDLQEVVIILPSKRAGVYFQQYLIEEIKAVQFAPDIFSIEAFIEHLSSFKKANQTHQLFCLYQAYQENVPKEAQDDFTVFMQWGTRLLKDFNDIDAYRLNAKVSLENLGEFYQIEGFNLPENTTYFRPVFWEALFAIYSDFQALLISQQTATLGMLYQDALDALEIYLQHTEKTHYFIGFNALNQAEQDMIQEFLAKNKGEVLWDLDQHFFDDPIHAAGRFIRHYQKEWKYYRQHPQTFDGTSFLEPKNIQAIGFSGNLEQAQFVKKFLATHQNQKGKTAVVLGNEHLLLPVLANLPSNLSHWNVTMGYAIEQLPICGFFLSLIDLHATAPAEGFDRKKVISLLSFPPLERQLTNDGLAVKKLRHQLNENFHPLVSVKEMSSFMGTKKERLLFSTVTKDVFLLADSLIELAEGFETDFYHNNEYFTCAVLALIKKVLNQMVVQLKTASFPVDCAAFYFLFQESISLQTLDFEGDPVQGVQLMGMLETRALDFDHILITNVNEGILPVGKNDQSFFPFAMKKKFGLPTFLDNDAIYSYHFYRLLQRAKNVYLLYNSKSEGLNAGEKSRFIRQLALTGLKQHNYSDRQFNLPFVAPRPKEKEVFKTAKMIEQLRELALLGFSPTSLSAYLVDPMSFYHRYLLKIKEEFTPTKTLSHFQRGIIVHDCLEELYADYVEQPMKVDDYDTMLAQLPDKLLHHYQKVYPNSPVPFGENHLILKAYERSLQQFLKREQALVLEGNSIVIKALELPFKVPLQHPSFKQEVYISGTIDRIDEFNGVTRLIDYKTGTVESSKLVWSNWDGFVGDYTRQALFQLLLYSWAQGTTKTVSLGIISLKTPKAYVLPLVRKDRAKDQSPNEVDAVFKKEIEHYLVKLVDEIFDEKKSFVSLEKDER
ncbi:MAG: PD-(D/E)XK nuclease family protein [Flavobacteriaceae bacterium]